MSTDQVPADRAAMLVAIGEAMQAYASFEFWLFNLVDVLLQTKRESAAAIFYSIRSNRDRNDVVTALIRSVTGDQYTAFWKSIRRHIEKINGMRNSLAHGLVILDIEGAVPRHLVTKPVAYWIEEGPEGPYLTKSDIISFSQKTAAITELLRHFGSYLRGRQPESYMTKWQPVFSTVVSFIRSPPGIRWPIRVRDDFDPLRHNTGQVQHSHNPALLRDRQGPVPHHSRVLAQSARSAPPPMRPSRSARYPSR
jgi:hypothetical protein